MNKATSTSNLLWTKGGKGVGVGHHNFWSIVLDDLWSKKICKPRMIVSSPVLHSFLSLDDPVSSIFHSTNNNNNNQKLIWKSNRIIKQNKSNLIIFSSIDFMLNDRHWTKIWFYCTKDKLNFSWGQHAKLDTPQQRAETKRKKTVIIFMMTKSYFTN